MRIIGLYVIKVSIYEYDKEREMRLIRADEREIGREEERKNTEKERQKAEAERKEKLQALKNNIKTVFLLCKELGSTKEETIKQVIEKCGLKEQAAEEKAELYWR